MTIILRLLGVAALVGTMQPASLSTIGTDEAALVKATFFSHTLDDDKDHDTGINVKVWTADRQTIVAHTDNRDNSGDDGTQYKDWSNHQFDLDLDSAGLPKSQARGFVSQVCIHTHGHDTWKWEGRVVLYFSDHTNLVATQGATELKNDGACSGTFGNQ